MYARLFGINLPWRRSFTILVFSILTFFLRTLFMFVSVQPHAILESLSLGMSCPCPLPFLLFLARGQGSGCHIEPYTFVPSARRLSQLVESSWVATFLIRLRNVKLVCKLNKWLLRCQYKTCLKFLIRREHTQSAILDLSSHQQQQKKGTNKMEWKIKQQTGAATKWTEMAEAQDMAKMYPGPGRTPFLPVTLDGGLCEPNVICQFCRLATGEPFVVHVLLAIGRPN